jgi:hypothetical protein
MATVAKKRSTFQSNRFSQRMQGMAFPYNQRYDFRGNFQLINPCFYGVD